MRKQVFEAVGDSSIGLRLGRIMAGFFMNIRLLVLLGTGCLISLAIGCGGKEPVGAVSGKVFYRGLPVATGSVVFEAAAGGETVLAPLQADGSFVVKTHDKAGLTPGSYKIAVTPTQIGSGEIPLAVNPGEAAAPPPPSVPAKYHTTATSGITANVQAGDNPPLELTLSD
jgi:hypothetical protein